MKNIWFQQDGATGHTAEATLDVLRHVFEDRIISRRADVVWPPRCCDLTPFYYYCHIWGTENLQAYIVKPTHPKRVTVWCGFWFRGIIGPRK